jgi:hypothetical protein
MSYFWMNYRLQDKVFDCVIGRRRITIQPSSFSLAKIFILKPLYIYKLAPMVLQNHVIHRFLYTIVVS